MLSRLRLEGFKAAEDLSLKLGSLTVLTGLNGSGKSTVLQALALLKQSYVHGQATGFRLRGPLMQVGTFSDAHTEGTQRDCIRISVVEHEVEMVWEMSGHADDATLPFTTQPAASPEFLAPEKFQLLPADRLVPRTVFSRSPDAHVDLGFLGPSGEYVVEYLLSDAARRLDVSAVRSFPKVGLGLSEALVGKAAPTKSLIDQVSGWLQQLSPGVRIDVKELVGTDDVMLRYNYVGRVGTSETDQQIRPSNVGFGLTYSLPIVVACLAARAGSLLLLENPEAHLHPQGQAALGSLLARCAADGVQVVVETHSDHVLNGIRVATKDGLISPHSVSINYFTRSVESGFVSVESPELSARGKLSKWPEGFFDQFERDLARL